MWFQLRPTCGALSVYLDLFDGCPVLLHEICCGCGEVHNERSDFCVPHQLNSLGVQQQQTGFTSAHDASYGVHTRPVVLAIQDSMLGHLAIQNIPLHLRAADEEELLTIDLSAASRSGGVYNMQTRGTGSDTSLLV